MLSLLIQRHRAGSLHSGMVMRLPQIRQETRAQISNVGFDPLRPIPCYSHEDFRRTAQSWSGFSIEVLTVLSVGSGANERHNSTNDRMTAKRSLELLELSTPVADPKVESYPRGVLILPWVAWPDMGGIIQITRRLPTPIWPDRVRRGGGIFVLGGNVTSHRDR